MLIKINGKDESIDKQKTLLGLIEDKGLNCERIVVEYNYRVVQRGEWQKIILGENDNLEIVSFVGGG